MSQLTCIIPARGGSTGILLKNLQVVGRVSLLARCIGTCKRAGIERIVVSTDHEEIAAEAERYGAGVHYRSAELSSNTALMWPLIQMLGREWNLNPVVWCQCTAPLMTAGDVRNCIAAVGSYDMAVAVHESHVFLFDQNAMPINFPLPCPRRQDFGRQYAISGSVWACTPEYLDAELYEGNIGLIQSEHTVRLDIDTPQDLSFARDIIRN